MTECLPSYDLSSSWVMDGIDRDGEGLRGTEGFPSGLGTPEEPPTEHSEAGLRAWTDLGGGMQQGIVITKA